ncbi:LPXTG cell wall anchor domain-containing protein [Kitasatospora sp. NPDC127111]|uniref:LPXTG cell wall anchor domain-containing protein n=1 Tax=Kitasatospora sp. NPDC127111 TaxID=3345363 RepID=UPI00364537E0
MRIRSTAARSLVAVPTAAALLLLAPTAEAAAGGKPAKGNNGTVKIHDAATGQEDTRNEPKVCTFYLDSFGFDPGQDIIWLIAEVHDKGENAVAFGDLPVDGKGHVRTEDINLPDGHYKLYWASVELVDGKLPADPDLNNPKHKVFKVDCGGKTPSPTGKPSPSATPTKTPPVSPSATPTVTKSPSQSPSATPTQTPSATVTPSATPSATPTVPASPTATATPSTSPSATPSTSPSATASATAAPTTEAPAPTTGPSTAPTATVPVQTPPANTVVNPDKPLIMPAAVSVPTPIPGAAQAGKNLASTGSDGTLLYAGAGTALLLAGAGAVVYTRRTRKSS